MSVRVDENDGKEIVIALCDALKKALLHATDFSFFRSSWWYYIVRWGGVLGYGEIVTMTTRKSLEKASQSCLHPVWTRAPGVWNLLDKVAVSPSVHFLFPPSFYLLKFCFSAFREPCGGGLQAPHSVPSSSCWCSCCWAADERRCAISHRLKQVIGHLMVRQKFFWLCKLWG